MYAGKFITMPRITPHFLFAGLLLLTTSGCTTVKKTLTVIPGMGPSGDAVSAQDPLMPFDYKGTLGYGHTLRLAVYDGAIEPSRLFNGLVMIDRQGIADFGKYGSARLGGHTIPEAQRLVESVFRRNGSAVGRVHVHVISIENTPLVTVEGDVATPVVMPLYKGLSLHEAVAQAGGRRAGSQAQAVYVTQKGVRRFYQSEAAADYGSPLGAGDIITLSPDL